MIMDKRQVALHGLGFTMPSVPSLTNIVNDPGAVINSIINESTGGILGTNTGGKVPEPLVNTCPEGQIPGGAGGCVPALAPRESDDGKIFGLPKTVAIVGGIVGLILVKKFLF